jgi:acetyl-CoA carboxylase carboxyl transferase subunit beta
MPDTLDTLVDPGSFQPEDDSLVSRDPLAFPGYADALERAREQAGVDESVVVGRAAIGGHPIELGVFNFAFFGGSMGEVAGERLARGLERAAERAVPFVVRTRTGGARMQEGMRSLVQMPKVIAARLTLADARRPLIAVLGNPTTGGVLASLAAAADVVLAESAAMIGFAGPRVAEVHTGRPAGRAHAAEAKLELGLVDAVGDLPALRDHIVRLLDILSSHDAEPPRLDDPPEAALPRPDGRAAVGAARAASRPTAPELLATMSDELVILRGDRAGTDDPALTAGVAKIEGRRALALALDRDHLPGPGAYRKARRCLRLAARLDLPVVTLVDTRGADPSDESESRGVAWEIAALFEDMLSAPVPIVSIVTGEGGSGGALAFATGDYLGALSDSIFSVIAPEAAAVILWRDPDRASDAADALRLTAHDLVELGIADDLIPAPTDAHSIGRTIAYHLARFAHLDVDRRDLVVSRRRRWRGMGHGSQREASP